MSMLAAFKLKPFDLEPVYTTWTSAPVFTGNPKKDGPVDKWLDAIKAGCQEHKVPKELWHVVAQHYMGEKARERLYEVKKVMLNLHGGKFKWNWKRYKVAMCNMSWDIDSKRTLPFKVGSLSSGIWWIIGKAEPVEPAPAPAPPPSKEPFLARTLKNLPNGGRSISEPSIDNQSIRSKKSFFSLNSGSSTPKKDSKPADAILKRSASVRETPASPGPAKRKSLMHTPKPSDDATLRVSHAPVWLLTACQSLESLNEEHPKVMSTLAAVLITVGSVPAIPAVSAGAAGAFLASTTAHALGSIAVGLGTWIGAQKEGLIEVS